MIRGHGSARRSEHVFITFSHNCVMKIYKQLTTCVAKPLKKLFCVFTLLVVDTFVETKVTHVVEKCICKRSAFSAVEAFVKTTISPDISTRSLLLASYVVYEYFEIQTIHECATYIMIIKICTCKLDRLYFLHFWTTKIMTIRILYGITF